MALPFNPLKSVQFYGSTTHRLSGVCGVFNREMCGEIIWFDGREYSVEIDDPFALPNELEAYLE
jgi:hypothetical protein